MKMGFRWCFFLKNHVVKITILARAVVCIRKQSTTIIISCKRRNFVSMVAHFKWSLPDVFPPQEPASGIFISSEKHFRGFFPAQE